MYNALNKELAYIAGDLGIKLENEDLKDKFRELIRKAAVNEQVVILIDEYDKPIIDYLSDIPRANENQIIFKEFYSVLKDADSYIRLLLITGVSKFSKVSIFSDLNNLEDITVLHPRYNAITGVTQQELEITFKQELEEEQRSNSEILQDIKRWYNGYSWDGNLTVYNPFSLLRYMNSRVFQHYWFETGTPIFLLEHLRKHNWFNFEQVRVDASELGSFQLEQKSCFCFGTD